MVPILDGNSCAIIVDKVVQMEKKMISNEAKEKVGMAKWLKKYDAKLEDSRLFMKHKQVILQVIL